MGHLEGVRRLGPGYLMQEDVHTLEQSSLQSLGVKLLFFQVPFVFMCIFIVVVAEAVALAVIGFAGGCSNIHANLVLKSWKRLGLSR